MRAVKLWIVLMLNVCFISAESAVVMGSPEAELLLEKNYIESTDSDNIFYFFASKTLNEGDCSLSSSELVDQFKQKVQEPDVAERYLAIYSAEFNDEQVKEVCELIQNDLYMKYRQPLAVANLKCHMETDRIFQELAVNDANAAKATKPSKSNTIIDLTSANYNEVINSSKPLVIEVYTEWCAPCKYLAPIFKELNDEYGSKYQFVKLDAGVEESVSAKYDITGVPTILYIKDGKELGRHVGFMGKEIFVSELKQYFKK